MSSASFHPSRYHLSLLRSSSSSFIRSSFASSPFRGQPLFLSRSLSLPLCPTSSPARPLSLGPGSINIPANESRLQRRFVRERTKLATHSPVRVQGKLRRSRICTGTVHQRRPPSRTRPATETENMSAIALQPLSFRSFPFTLPFALFSFSLFTGTNPVASQLPRDHFQPPLLPPCCCQFSRYRASFSEFPPTMILSVFFFFFPFFDKFLIRTSRFWLFLHFEMYFDKL